MPAKKAPKRRKAKKKAKEPKPGIVVNVYMPQDTGPEPGLLRAIKALEEEPEWTFL
jgi:hypothetical protein